jgi:hypothetical protein
MTRALAAVAVVLVVAGGCRRPAPEAAVTPPAAAATSPRAAPDKLLAGALAVLDRLDDFDEARGAELVFDRVNQWSRAAPADAPGWRPEPLVATLPAPLRAGAEPETLASGAFTLSGDVTYLRDQRWLADVARVARGDAVDDLAVAENLFRWTVRSLALVGDPPMVPTERNPGVRWCLPGEILLAGRASGPQRAWVFLELARHAGLVGVMLATGDAAAGTLRPWIPAIVIEDEAYLFEPVYGMPIPGPGGTGVATARQAAADHSILAAMSLPDRGYPIQAADVAGLTPLVPADPWNLSRRMSRLDRQLRGLRDMRLVVDAQAVARTAAAAVPAGRTGDGPAAARLWEFPWETLARRRADAANVSTAVRRELAPLGVPVRRESGQISRPLFAARLREFRGDVAGPTGAKAAYLAARPSRATVAAAVAGMPPDEAERARALFAQAKEDAAYWLGVLALAEGDAPTAIDYLSRMTLDAAPDSRWADAARTNLAQALIASGRPDEAIPVLTADLSPQRFGSRLLARWLAERKPDGAGKVRTP